MQPWHLVILSVFWGRIRTESENDPRGDMKYRIGNVVPHTVITVSGARWIPDYWGVSP